MNLEEAQNIIEQEALLILLADPELAFDVDNGSLLSEFFHNNESKIVTQYEFSFIENIDEETISSYVFKINHPKHRIGYYKVSGCSDSRTNTYWYEQSIVRPSKRQRDVWVVLEGFRFTR